MMPAGAHRPIAAYGGITAIVNVPIIIKPIDSNSDTLRPARSASEPSTSPPSGRIRYEMPKVPSVSINEIASVRAGKNSFAIVTAKNP